MQQYQKSNDYQLRQILKTITGVPECLDIDGYPEIVDVFDMLFHGSYLHLPCDPYKLFVIYERFPVWSDINQSVNKSVLLRQLFDRADETGVVVDSVFSGRKAVFLARLVKTRHEIANWLDCMHEVTMEANLKKIDEEYKVIISPLFSFVHPRSEL